MDGRQFDALTRRLSAGITRRTFAGAALAGLLTLPATPARAARGSCRDAGRHCHPRRPCCPGTACLDGRCQPLATCGAVFCPAGEICCNESCGICTPTGDGCTQELCE